MKDDSHNVEHRLRWLIRSIVVAAIAVAIAIAIGTWMMLRKPQTEVKTTVLSVASAPGVESTSAAKAATSAASPSQTEASAAAAMRALAASGAKAASGPMPLHAASGAQGAAQPSGPMSGENAAPAVAPTPEAAPAVAPPAQVRLTHSSSAPVQSTHKQTVKPHAAEKPQRHAAAHRPPAEREQAAASAERFPTRPAAERQAVHAGASGSVAGLPRCATPGWYVQMGAFAETGSIDRLARKLRGMGYQAFCIGPAHPKGLKLFYVGAYVSAEAAIRARDRLDKQTGVRGIVRRLRAE